MRSDMNRRVSTAPYLAALIVGLLATSVLQANPKGGAVTNGTITITDTPGVLTINQTTPRGIIHWQDFSIGAGELTNFIHLDAKSATLNRVVGGIPSSIQGTLQANGQIYLVNPNGILVGPGGRINTAAFTASTLDVPDAQFMAGGDMRFSGPSLQGVVNLGVITATTGDVILLGRNVLNAGSIEAPNGVAALAAGNDILLQAAGDERVVINSGIVGGGTGAENTGSIKAAQAELKAAGGNVYALAVNNTGVIKATGIAQKNGRVILSSNGGIVQNSGQISAKNLDRSGGSVKLDSGKGGSTTNNGSIDASADDLKKNGGTVELLGDTVTVGSSSVINVNGANAGTVAIGVSALIANQTTATGGIATLTAIPVAPGAAPITTAQQATIQANSRILANSTSAGNGGRVIVWSEKQSVVGGIIEAKGGDLGGNGGLVETSGRTGLTIIPGTKVNTNAPKGKAGTWLLDPAGITIDNTASDTANGSSSPFDQNAATNHVRASDIVTALGSGNVTVTTTGFPANADIIVASAISIPAPLGGAHLLTLDSAGGISINAAIGGAASDVILQMQSHGDININSGGAIQMNGVSAYAITGNLNIADQITALNNKNIFLNAPTGSIAFTGSGQAKASSSATVFLDTHSTTTGTITGSSGGNAVVAGKLDITSGRQGIGTPANPLTTSVSYLEATVASNSQTTGGGIFIKNSGVDLHIGGVDPTLNGVQVSNLPGFGGIEITNIAGDLLLDSSTAERITAPGNIKLTTSNSFDIQVLNASPNSIRSANGSVTLNAGRNILIGDAGTSTLGINVRGRTSVDLTAGGDVSVSGSLLKAGGGTGLTVNAGGDINILTSGGFAATIGTSGGVPVSLTTGLGKTFNNNTLSNGGVKTTLTDDVTNAVSTGADITIKADLMTLNAPVNAGSGKVTLIPVGVHRAIDLGTKTAGKLALTASELNNITAPIVRIGGQLVSDGNLTVNAPISRAVATDLELSSGGNVLPSSSITLPAGSTLTLRATGNIGDQNNGSGNITTQGLVAITSNGFISLGGTGILTLGAVQFTSGSYAYIGGGSSPISNISSSISTGAFTVISSVDLTINGANQSGGSAFINTGGNLTFAPGSSLYISNDSDFLLPHGNFINNSGPNAITGTGRFIVWERDPFSPHQKGGLSASDYTSAPVQYPNDPLGGGNVFYFSNLTQTAQSIHPSPPRRLFALPTPTAPPANETDREFRVRISLLSMDQLIALFADSSIKDNKLFFLQQEVIYRNTVSGIAAYNANEANREAAEVAQAVRDIQGGSEAVLAQKRAVISALIDPTVLDMNNSAVSGAFYGSSIAAMVAKVNLSSFSLNQLQFMTRAELLAMLSSAGVALSPADRKVAAAATMTQDQLGSIIKTGNGLDPNQFASLVSAGAGNLTVNQIVAAGAGNLISQDGAGLISQDGAGFKVIGRQGQLISNDGASMTVLQLAKLISNDGASLVSDDGGSLLSENGLGVVSNDGNSLISQDGAGLLKAVVGLISQDGAGILAGAKLISQDGAGFKPGAALISQDGAGFKSGASLISQDGAGYIPPAMNFKPNGN